MFCKFVGIEFGSRTPNDKNIHPLRGVQRVRMCSVLPARYLADFFVYDIRRLKIFERDNFSCRFCGKEDREIQVHHTAYFGYIDPWAYDDHYLITLCHKCHQSETDNRKDSDKELSAAFCQIGFSHHDIDLIKQLIIEDKGKVISFFRYEVFNRYTIKHTQK